MWKILFKYLLKNEHEREKLVPWATSFFPSFVRLSFTPVSSLDFPALHFTFSFPYRIPYDMTIFTHWQQMPKISPGFCHFCLYLASRGLLGKPHGCTAFLLLPYNKRLMFASALSFHPLPLLWWNRCPLFYIRMIPLLFSESRFLQLLQSSAPLCIPFLSCSLSAGYS